MIAINFAGFAFRPCYSYFPRCVYGHNQIVYCADCLSDRRREWHKQTRKWDRCFSALGLSEVRDLRDPESEEGHLKAYLNVVIWLFAILIIHELERYHDISISLNIISQNTEHKNSPVSRWKTRGSPADEQTSEVAGLFPVHFPAASRSPISPPLAKAVV